MSILAVEHPIFQRAMRIISTITNGYPALVTTTFAHNYQSGEIVRLVIPHGYGMVQANQKQGTITVTGDTTFTIDIDTTYFNAFTVPGSYPDSYQSAQVVPVGEENDQLEGATQNVLPYRAI